MYRDTRSLYSLDRELCKAIITIITRRMFSSCHMIMVEFVWLNLYGYPSFQRNYLLYYRYPDPPFQSIGGAALARLRACIFTFKYGYSHQA